MKNLLLSLFIFKTLAWNDTNNGDPNIRYNLYHKLSLTDPWSLHTEEIAGTNYDIAITNSQEFFAIKSTNIVTGQESGFSTK